MKILYIGSGGDLSLQPLRYLLQSEHQLCAVAVDSQADTTYSDTRLPVLTENGNSVETLARASELPIINLSNSLRDVVAAIEQLAPDLIVVSCYGRKLPKAILGIPFFGCFNFHPSMLPAYRGPVPVFWQFHDGLSEFGVTLHRMTERMDAGDIVARRAVVMPDGVSQTRAHQLLAEDYVELFPDFLTAIELGTLAVRPQDESAMSYQGFPANDDFRVYTSWSAKRIFNFICATTHYDVVYPCRIAGIEYKLHYVLGYNQEQLPDEECVIDGHTIQIACNPGVLLARFVPA